MSSPGRGVVAAAAFRPHPLLRNAHLQTLVPNLFRPSPRIGLETERWETDDNDFVDLGWFARPAKGQPLAILVHGLTGGFESKYLRGTARKLQRAGWAGLVLQLRGAGPQPNRLPRNYHQGDTQDLHRLLAELRRRYPGSPLATVGWSLGGNIVLKAAGEAGADHLADFVVAASVPFALEPCVRRLNSGFSRVYQRRLLGSLKVMVEQKAAAVDMPPQIDLAAALRATDFRAYDDAWTAPLHGFRDAKDYYRKTQCGNFLAAICRPTLIIHSADDPFMDPTIAPKPQELAPSVRLEISSHGGHVGFMARGRWGLPEFWLEKRILNWLQEARALRAA